MPDGSCTLAYISCRILPLSIFSTLMGSNMLELNLIFARIKDMQERVEALRGYL